MGEYVILCHFKAFQIPLHHSTNKKNNENSEKRSNRHTLCYSSHFNVREQPTLSGANIGFPVE